MTAYSYETFCQAVAGIHGHACWVRRIVTQRPMAIPSSWERCGGQMDGHHLIPKRVLKRERPQGVAVELGPCGFDPAAIRFTREGVRVFLADILNEGRNGVPACRHHHDLVENAVILLRREELPQQTEQFAEEIGLGWYLDRTFGPLASVPILSTCDGCGHTCEVRVYGPEIHYCDGCAPVEG